MTDDDHKLKGAIGPLFIWTSSDYQAIMGLLIQIVSQQQETQRTLNQLLKQENKVMSALDDLQAQVHANTDLEQSAISLIQGIAQQLQEAIHNDDSAALQALSQQLQSSAAALGAAVAANTQGDAPQVNPLSAKRK